VKVETEVEAETEAGMEVGAAEQRPQNEGGSLPRLERAMVMVVATGRIYCWRMWLSGGSTRGKSPTATEAPARRTRV
jgi:hypothetical protein